MAWPRTSRVVVCSVLLALSTEVVAAPDGRWLEGTVVDPDGRPIAGATVGWDEPSGARTTTGATGSFRLEVDGLRSCVVVTAPGFVGEVLEARGRRPIQAILERGATLRGVVRGPGAAGARVVARNLDAVCCCVPQGYTATCDPLGAFVLEGLVEARFALEAVSDEAPAGRSAPLVLLASAFREHAPLELTLVEGRPPPATDRAGRPVVDGLAPPPAARPEVPSGRLDLSRLGEGARRATASSDGRSYRDADGELPLGPAHVVVAASGQAAAGWFEVRPDVATVVDLPLAPAARVRGRLVDPLGRAARLWLDLAGGGSTGPDGRFERVLPPGRWTLWVREGRGLELVAARFGRERATLERTVVVAGAGDVDLGDVVVEVE